MFGAATATGFYQLRILWQNPMGLGFFPCIANLSSVTSFGLTPDNVMSTPSAGDVAPAKLSFGLQVSFCLANITLLSPTLVTSGQRLSM